MAEYALEFHTQVAGSGGNEPALKAMFHQDLDLLILTELACHDEQHILDSLIDLAFKLDNLLPNRPSLQHAPVNIQPAQSPPPMEVSNTCMPHSERGETLGGTMLLLW